MKKNARERYRQKKKGPLSPLVIKGNQKPTAPEVNESQTFFQVPEGNKENFRGREQYAFQSPLLQPIKNVVALAKLGVRPPHMKQRKVFRSFGASTDDVTGFAIDSTTAGGVYRGNSSVFFSAASSRSLDQIWSFKEHEEAHFVMKEIFDNDSEPYFQDDTITKDLFGMITLRTLCDIGNLPQVKLFLKTEVKPKGSKTWDAIFSVLKIFQYPESERGKELIVKVPEIMGLLGNEEGYKWLKQYTPELLDFYENMVNPALNKYLDAMEFKKYVDNSRVTEKKAPNKSSDVPNHQKVEPQHRPLPAIPPKPLGTMDADKVGGWAQKVAPKNRPLPAAPVSKQPKPSVPSALPKRDHETGAPGKQETEPSGQSKFQEIRNKFERGGGGLSL